MSDSREDIKICSVCEIKVNGNLDEDDVTATNCYYCRILFCEECTDDNDSYILMPDGTGMCYNCAVSRKDDKHFKYEAIYFKSWQKIYNDKEAKEEEIQEKDIYIKQLEAEIELLKTMLHFQPDGDGYLATSTHFKQLATDQNKTIFVTDQMELPS